MTGRIGGNAGTQRHPGAGGEVEHGDDVAAAPEGEAAGPVAEGPPPVAAAPAPAPTSPEPSKGLGLMMLLRAFSSGAVAYKFSKWRKWKNEGHALMPMMNRTAHGTWTAGVGLRF